MRAGLVVSGVLGAGTAVVFVLAALTATLFPNGTVVSSGMNGMMIDRGWAGGGVAIPMPAPAMDVPGVITKDQMIIQDGTRELAPAP
jgi:hypothetical protein